MSAEENAIFQSMLNTATRRISNEQCVKSTILIK